MTQSKFRPLLLALACAAALAFAPAQAKQATVACEDSAMAVAGLPCIGPFKHSGGALGEVASAFGSVYALASASDSDDPFIDAPGGARKGTLTFDEALFGPFVVGIRAGNMFSFYLFDGDADGVESILFDTEGVVERGNAQAGVMTQALLFTPGGALPRADSPPGGGTDDVIVTPPAAQQVPEPASGALAIVALAAAALTARRRRR